MSLRELFGERELLLLLLAIVLFFMAVGILVRVPGGTASSPPNGTHPVTLEQLGLDDPRLKDDPWIALPGFLEDWNNQKLIGH